MYVYVCVYVTDRSWSCPSSASWGASCRRGWAPSSPPSPNTYMSVSPIHTYTGRQIPRRWCFRARPSSPRPGWGPGSSWPASRPSCGPSPPPPSTPHPSQSTTQHSTQCSSQASGSIVYVCMYVCVWPTNPSTLQDPLLRAEGFVELGVVRDHEDAALEVLDGGR